MDNDFWESKIAERQTEKLSSKEQTLLRSTEWGDEGCEKLSQIVQNCINQKRGATYWKSSVFRDCEFYEAVDMAFSNLGLNPDENSWLIPELYNRGNQFEIQF